MWFIVISVLSILWCVVLAKKVGRVVLEGEKNECVRVEYLEIPDTFP